MKAKATGRQVNQSELAGERSHYVDEVIYHYNGSRNTDEYDAKSKAVQRSPSARLKINVLPRNLRAVYNQKKLRKEMVVSWLLKDDVASILYRDGWCAVFC